MSTLVPVMVPEERLADAYRALGAMLTASSAVEPDPTEVDSDPEFWRNPDNVKSHLVPRSDTIKGLARYLAEHPDTEITAAHAAEELGLEYGWNSLAGALGAFGRYCANRELGFPWESWYDDDGYARMQLDAATAAVILAVL